MNTKQLKKLNPYKAGSFRWQQFNTHMGWYGTHPTSALVSSARELRREANNYCRYSWSMMSNMDTEAGDIETVIKARMVTL